MSLVDEDTCEYLYHFYADIFVYFDVACTNTGIDAETCLKAEESLSPLRVNPFYSIERSEKHKSWIMQNARDYVTALISEQFPKS